MKIGIFSNGQARRPLPTAGDTWDEDIWEIQLAERLGFGEAWISEHTGTEVAVHAMGLPELMIAKAAAVTDTIRLGPAIRRLALFHPVQVAMETAITDHLTHGRYMFGFGSGFRQTGYEQRGIDHDDVHAMMAEAIDLVERCWSSTEPFDHHGRYYRGQGINVWPKPHQDPLPIAVATTRGPLLAKAGQRGWSLLTSGFASASTVKQLANVYAGGAAAAGQAAPRGGVSVARAIYVADTDERAMAEIGPAWQTHLDIHRIHQPFTLADYMPASGDLNDLTLAGAMDQGWLFAGSPDTIVQNIEDHFRKSGGFGQLLLLAGKDWGTREQRERSWELFANKVAPRLAHLQPDVDVDTHAEAIEPRVMERALG